MNLLIKIPTRERGFDWLESYVQNITNPNTRIYLTLDMNDVGLSGAVEIKERYPNVYLSLGDSTGKIDAVNRDMEYISDNFNWDVLLLGSDDMQPQMKGFDDLILQHFENDKDKFLWSSDGRQPRICTIPIMDREYYERFGYIYHPNYKSFFCDNFQTDVALRLNKCSKTNECYLMHQHPAWGGTVENDNLYRRNDAFWNEDAKTYKIMSREITNYLGK